MTVQGRSTPGETKMMPSSPFSKGPKQIRPTNRFNSRVWASISALLWWGLPIHHGHLAESTLCLEITNETTLAYHNGSNKLANPYLDTNPR
jgi:hypothetical protein